LTENYFFETLPVVLGFVPHIYVARSKARNKRVVSDSWRQNF